MTRWIVIAAAVAVGFFMLGYDQRTDDTGVEVALLIAVSLALAAAAPRAALAVALGVGLPIAAYSLMHGNGPGVMALLITGAGAFLGWTMRKGAQATSHIET
ncbi:MAG TPA: hypothetical protein VM052_04585 [Candidatus Limnocylindrales bacterium]|nr:hypothetical protein [Candidatus Limnocylindrales bacterium]